jgi:hypothetical protein
MRCTMLAAAFAAAFAVPVSAQSECEEDLQQVWAAVEASQITPDQKREVGAILQEAYALAQMGDEAGCVEILDQVKAALGIGQT